MIRVASGRFRVTILDGGRLWLDGGSMFGVVPKTLWSRLRAPDDRNRIELGMNLLLVEDGRRRILVDTGAGAKWDEKGRAIYGLEIRSPEEFLAPAGLTPDDVDLVVNTHLHFDHAGGNTRLGADGRPSPAFANARHVVQREELAFARLDNERIRASYQRENFEPLVAEGRLELLDGNGEIAPGISVRVAPGHTPGMQVVLVETGERTLAFLADLVPMASHVPYPYIMGYDVEPLRTLESKKRLLAEAAREDWLLVFEHDATMPLARLEERDGRLAAVRADGAEG